MLKLVARLFKEKFDAIYKNNQFLQLDMEPILNDQLNCFEQYADQMSVKVKR
jgi:hypothetical protein